MPRILMEEEGIGTDGFSTACAAATTSFCVAATPTSGDFACNVGAPLGRGERVDIAITGLSAKKFAAVLR